MIIYFDTETTGLRPGNICQLSYVIQEAGKVRAKNFYFAVDFVEYSAMMVHGLSPEKLKELSGGKRFDDCVDEIDNDFQSASLVIAHNFSFDFSFMSKEFENCCRNFKFQQELCSMKTFTPICALKRSDNVRYKYPKLVELCSHFGICDGDVALKTSQLFGDGGNFHDARFDTTALYMAFNKASQTNDKIACILRENL